MEEMYELEYTGSIYTGDKKNGRLEGNGTYEFESGNKYVGELLDGKFHGEGVMYMTTGAKIVGIWKEGKMIEGKLTFADNLDFKPEDDWDYCKSPDRRFYTEVCNGLRAAGRSQLTDEHPPKTIPKGHYDTGDGFYDPVERIIKNYEGGFLRNADDEEHLWILTKCRKAWDEIVGFKEINKN
ncbi:unnamed protein product [Oikopleura dioica]|uniref:MORN repeat-containing protein 5 n=1 Tax=Oikopleura dioica TaxID=34765 RepID=E4X856_OIKDI|nr:unnamed protein product [Oikopleura dioica]CBY32533.1 unnamed protein product [Oikopleura dioica]